MAISSQRTNTKLKEITNLTKNIVPIKPTYRIDEFLSIEPRHLDFGLCLPTSNHEKKFMINFKRTLTNPRVVELRLHPKSHSTQSNSDNLFGIRKEPSLEYYDDFKFRAVEKGVYTFQIGAQVPIATERPIILQISVTMQGVEGSLVGIITILTHLPTLTCSKQLTMCNTEQQVIKLSLNKKRKEIKIPFKFDCNFNMTLEAEIIGLEEDSLIQTKPKVINIVNKNFFVVGVQINNSPSIKSIYRRVLILRPKNSQIHYHFPLEILYRPEEVVLAQS